MTNQLTQAELIDLADQCGIALSNGYFADDLENEFIFHIDDLAKFARLIQQQALEEAAQACIDNLIGDSEPKYESTYNDGCNDCATAIRALKDQPVDHIPGATKMVEKPTENMLNAAVKFALQVSLSAEYSWRQYMTDLYAVFMKHAPVEQGGDELVEDLPSKFVTVEEAGQPEYGLYLAIYREHLAFPIGLIEYGSYSFYNDDDITLPDEDDDGMVTRIGWSETLPDSLHDSFCYERDVIAYVPVDLSTKANGMEELRQALANRRGEE